MTQNEIYKLAGGKEYGDYLLRARQQFIKGQAATLEEVRDVYRSAALSIAEDIKKLTPGELDFQHLTALQKVLDDRATQMSHDILTATHNGIWMSSEAASNGVANITERMTEGVMPAASVKKMFAGVNERATLAMLARTRRDNLKISDRVWRATEAARNSVRQIVEDAVARGQNSRVTARQVQQYLQPGIWKAHKLEIQNKLGISADVSYQAMRLARTEMNNAFHEGMVAANQYNPGYRGIYWRLSAQHVVPDICTDMAEDMSNGSAGFYPKGQEPVRPHPQCMCVAVPEYEGIDSFIARLKDWQANPHRQPDIDSWYNEAARRFIGRTVVTVPPPAPPPVAKEPETFSDVVQAIKMRLKLEKKYLPDEKDYKQAGKMVQDDLKKRREHMLKEIEDLKKELIPLRAHADAANSETARLFDLKFQVITDKIKIEDTGFKSLEDLNERQKVLSSISKRAVRVQNKLSRMEEVHAGDPINNAKELKNKLSEVREMGLGEVGEKGVREHMGVGARKLTNVEKAVMDAYDLYPTEWVKTSVEYGNISVKEAIGRGMYASFRKEISITRDNPVNTLKTAIHELGHRFEDVAPKLVIDQKQFYNRRTKGNPLVPLSKLQSGYRPDEFAREGNFLNPYMGKDYGGKAFELLSMGVDLAFTNPTKLWQDEDYATWIYGILALN